MAFNKRQFICLGNPEDINTASGTPYFILKYGKKIGLISGFIPFKLNKIKISKYFWNLNQILKTGKYGGYQYSEQFLKKFQRSILKKSSQLGNLNILSYYPSLPIYPWPKNILVDFYIDATNLQIFNDYGYGSTIDEKYKLKIINRERNAYKAAGNIFCMCQWAVDSVIKDYGINPKKVHLVIGGPNLKEEEIKNKRNFSFPKEPSKSVPLVIGFLGKNWKRKGGDFALEVVRNLNSSGIYSVLRVMGARKKDLPNSPFLECLGFIDKKDDLNKFVKELSGWHFCALFSEKEASPRSNLENIRLGVPILSHDIGGISSTFINNTYSKLFNPFPSVREVTEWIISEIKPYKNYCQKRESTMEICKNITN